MKLTQKDQKIQKKFCRKINVITDETLAFDQYITLIFDVNLFKKKKVDLFGRNNRYIRNAMAPLRTMFQYVHKNELMDDFFTYRNYLNKRRFRPCNSYMELLNLHKIID